MNKVVSPMAKINLKNFISFPELKAMRQSSKPVLVVEIGKQPSTLFKNSLWIGYRNGGMASWLASLLPHLPHNQFCLYMDEDAYKGSQYMYNYYSQYFSKLFHKQYIGTCIHSRKLICRSEMTGLNEIKASQLQQKLKNTQFDHSPTVLLDLRGPQMASKCSINKVIKGYSNASYINLPLNDEDLIDSLHSKTIHLPSTTKFITMCAKGYRSTIGYSLLNLIKKPQWNIQLCRDPSTDIKHELSKPVPTKPQSFTSFAPQQFAFS